MPKDTDGLALPKGTIPAGRLFGVPLRIYKSSAISAAMFTWLATGQFEAWMPDGTSRPVLWAMGLGGYLGLMACLLAHEFGHVLVARRFGVACRDVSLTPLGMVAQVDMDLRSPNVEAAIAAAGPAVSIALAYAAMAATYLPLPEILAHQIWWLIYANLGIAIFNLIPCYPMDGGRLVRALAWGITGSVSKGTRIAAMVGWGGAALLLVLAALQLVAGNPMGILTAVAAIAMVTYAGRESTLHDKSEPVVPKTARSLMRAFASDIHAAGPTVTLVPGLQGGRVELMVAIWRLGIQVGLFPAGSVGRVSPDADLSVVMDAFLDKGKGSWPIVIVDDGDPLGYIAQGDVMAAISPTSDRQEAA